jgi:hypothetical protein
MKTFILLTFVCFIHALAYSADDLGKTLIGKWTWIGGQQYEFAADHTGTMTQGGKTLKLRWRVDGTKVPITILRPDGQEAFTWQITRGASQDELTLTNPPKTEGVELSRVGTHPKRIDEEQERVCLNRLAKIASAFRGYMLDHDGSLPTTIEELFPDYMPEHPSTRAEMVSPFSPDPKTPSYELMTPGANLSKLKPDTVVLRCKYKSPLGKRSVYFASDKWELVTDK